MTEKERQELSKIAHDIRDVVPDVVEISPLRLGEDFYSLEVIFKKEIKTGKKQ